MSIRCRIDGHVARITLADPGRGNPLSHTSVTALLAAWGQARDAGVRVVVLDAEGWAFSVGGDLKAITASPSAPAYVTELAELLHRLVREWHQADAVVVSVVQGAAAGAGFPLALSADLVLATEQARFTLGYAAVGLTPDGGATLLTRIVGRYRALELALLNDTVDGAAAVALGLANRVVTEPERDVAEIVARLLAGSATAQRATKRLVRDASVADLASVLDHEAAAVTAAAATSESSDRIAAFLDRRPGPDSRQPTRAAGSRP